MIKKIIVKIFLMPLLACCNPVDLIRERFDKCKTVLNIYYKPGRNSYENPEYFRKSERCPYTLTEISTDTPTVYIQAKFYDEYKKEYESWGLVYPYPRNVGSPVLYPIRY